MPVNSRGQRVQTHHNTKDKQKAQASALRKKKSPTGNSPIGIGPSGAAVGGGS